LQISRLNAATFSQLKDYLDTVIVPIGAIESHGTYSPFGTDYMIAERIVQELEHRFSGRVVTLPAIAFGHCFALKDRDGTIDIPVDVLRDYVYHVLRPFRGWGFSKIVLVNGHGGNLTVLNQVAEMLVDDGMIVLISNWWLDYHAEIKQITPGVGHGGEDETSVVMAIDSDLIDLSNAKPHLRSIPQGLRYPGMSHDLYPDGYSGNPAAASAAKGNTILKLVVERLAEQITSLWTRENKS
jgi:creatinine amidohydrolase